MKPETSKTEVITLIGLIQNIQCQRAMLYAIFSVCNKCLISDEFMSEYIYMLKILTNKCSNIFVFKNSTYIT